MAKKNRDRGNKQQHAAGTRSTEEQRPSSMEDRSEQVQSRISPSTSDTGHKSKQKRFGHN